MKIDKKGIDFIKQHEASVPFCYLDQSNYLTIGVGHLCVEGDYYLHGKNLHRLTEEAVSNRKRFKGGILQKNKKKYFFSVPTSLYVKNLTTISEKEVDLILKKDLDRFCNVINKYVKVYLNQNMFNALVSFCFNIGISAFRRSTLLSKLNRGEYYQASYEFEKYCFSNGKKLEVLQNRRLDEMFLFIGVTPIF